MIRKIAHLADIHIRRLPTRDEEYKHVFKNLFKSLKKEKPDRIVVVGDLVHNYIDLGTEQLVLIKMFLIGLADIAPVIVTMGNHDFRKKNSKRLDAVAAIIEMLGRSDIVYYNKTGAYVDDNVTWMVWHHGAKNNDPWRTKAGKEILANPEHHFTIDLFHDPINGCKSASGFEMSKNSYYKLKDFKGNLSMLGDIHLQQSFDGDTKAYSSSLVAQDFSEGDDKFHGYLMWDLEKEDNWFKKIPVKNDWSFKNVKLTPFTDFEDLECEIDNPTKHMKVRVVWGTLPSARNNENERKVITYLKENYPNAIISHKNEFAEDDTIEVSESIDIDSVQEQEVQQDIFRGYLDKIGVEEDVIEDVLKLDDEITSKLEVDGNTNIEWNIIKFGGTNFMSYESVDIDWRDKDGLYQITGINTAGKTTIIKLISYILFSQTLETKTRVKYGDSRFVNNKTGANYCDGYLVLEINGEYYGIKRRTDIERKKNGEIKGAPTKVFYYVLSSPDDEMTDENCIDSLTEDNRIQTQKKINEIIGSFDNFNRIVLTTSDTLNRILSNDMAEFIDSLLSDSGLDIFDKKLEVIKEHLKEVNAKSRLSCNIPTTEEEIKNLNIAINDLQNIIDDVNNVKLPELQDKIVRGENYIDSLSNKLFNIDPEIANLNVKETEDAILVHNNEIIDLNARKTTLEGSIQTLKDSYDSARLEELTNKRDKHKDEEYTNRILIKEHQQTLREIDHEIEIINGKIHVLKKDGESKKQEILNLRNSKTCPTCGQLMTEEHRKHIDIKIKEIEKLMYEVADTIKGHNEDIETVHKPKIEDYNGRILKINEEIANKSIEMESVLDEIGDLNNDKNDVEKRDKLKVELGQIPTKIQNEDLKKSILEANLTNYSNSLKQIEENTKINAGIKLARTKLTGLRDTETSLKQSVLSNGSTIQLHEEKIQSNQDLIKDFKEQEYQDRLLALYKKCVHRDGIPRQMLINYIIPQVNVELDNVLSVAPFKVWLDVEDLRPKLAYYNTPNAVIDAISSSGKERTFASVVLKLALNEINVKSKPTIFLLDEVMGKLSENSVEEFVQILNVIKEKCKKFIIIEHMHEVHPDFVISVNRTEEGVSTAILE